MAFSWSFVGISITIFGVLLFTASADNITNCDTPWIAVSNARTLGGIAKPNYSANLTYCQQQCGSTISCLGVDWDPGNPNGIFCWFSTTTLYSPVKVSDYGYNVTHYYCDGAIPKSPKGCYWNVSASTGTDAGVLVPAATTLEDCVITCLRRPTTCFGFDWGASDNACYISSTNTTIPGRTGVIHFQLVCSAGLRIFEMGFLVNSITTAFLVTILILFN